MTKDELIKVSFSKKEKLLLDFVFTKKQSEYYDSLESGIEGVSFNDKEALFVIKTRCNFLDFFIEELEGIKNRSVLEIAFSPEEYLFLISFIQELIEENSDQRLLSELKALKKKVLLSLEDHPLKVKINELLKVC